MEAMLVATALFLAFSNGANDNFKGFATVWGSETLDYRQALFLATLATLAGSILSLYLANGLVQQFSGKGLLPQSIVSGSQFIASVGIGAALTVMIATRAGLPISTTHALIGGIVGAAWAASPGDIQFAQLWEAFLMPLLFAPVAAAVLGLLVYRLLNRGAAAHDCACVIPEQAVLPQAGPGLTLVAASPLQIRIASDRECDAAVPPIARFSIVRVLGSLHIASACLICFARAVNDTPKLAALLITVHVLDSGLSLLFIALAMAAGGVLWARRVAETMSRRVTRMDHKQGVSANLITAVLVLGASQFGLPVSTTHVAVGSIAGVGAGGRTLNWGTLRNVLLSWIATLPIAAGIGWSAFTIMA